MSAACLDFHTYWPKLSHATLSLSGSEERFHHQEALESEDRAEGRKTQANPLKASWKVSVTTESAEKIFLGSRHPFVK